MQKFWTFCEKIIVFFVKLFKFKNPEKVVKTLMQFVKFGLVGVSNTLIHYAVYLLSLKLGAHYILASVLGFVVSVTNSFYWNYKYVFASEKKDKKSVLKMYLKTVMSYAGTGLILSNALLVVWVECLNISEKIGPILSLLITVPLNFIINKLWAFKNK